MSALFGIISKSGKIEKNTKVKIDNLKNKFFTCRYDYLDTIRDEWCYFFSSNVQESFINNNINNDVLFIIEGEVFLDFSYSGNINEKLTKNTHRNHNNLLCDLYQELGIKFLNAIKGNFNLIIVNKSLHSAYICNDYLGIKPLYYCEQGNYIAFFSELKFFNEIFDDSIVEIDKVTVAEYLLFNYPLGEDTFYKNVKLLAPGSLLSFENYHFSITQYFNLISLYKSDLYSLKESRVLLNDLFRKVVRSIVPENNYSLSVTGGFDGRTILSVIEDFDPLLTYTFGTENSSDIKVAQSIAEKLNIRHKAYYINEAYYNNTFFDSGLEIILESDSLVTFSRTHYLNTFKDICNFSKIVLSGNGGSELFRAMHRGGATVSNVFIDLLSNRDDPSRNILNHLENSYIPKVIIGYNKKLKEEIIERVIEKMNPFLNCETKSIGMNYFILKETIRKYFGNEMKVESKYAINRSPYIDKDFVATLNETPYSSTYQSFMTKNPILRHKGQMLYGYINSINNPVLAKINTNRGYSPFDIYDRFKFWRILAPYLMKYIKKKENSFNADQTSELFINRYITRSDLQNEIIDFKVLQSLYSQKIWKSNRIQFNQLLSWTIWYNNIFSKKNK